MKINNAHTEVTFSFTPSEYFLVYTDDETAPSKWSLNYRIDRSEKGKDDDVGSPVLFLTDNEAEECKKAGFSWLEI